MTTNLYFSPFLKNITNTVAERYIDSLDNLSSLSVINGNVNFTGSTINVTGATFIGGSFFPNTASVSLLQASIIQQNPTLGGINIDTDPIGGSLVRFSCPAVGANGSTQITVDEEDITAISTGATFGRSCTMQLSGGTAALGSLITLDYGGSAVDNGNLTMQGASLSLTTSTVGTNLGITIQPGLIFQINPLPGDYPNDATAAANGVTIGGIYRNGNQILMRIA